MLYLVIMVIILMLLLACDPREFFKISKTYGDQTITFNKNPSDPSYRYIDLKTVNNIDVPDPYVLTNKSLYIVN